MPFPPCGGAGAAIRMAGRGAHAAAACRAETGHGRERWSFECSVKGGAGQHQFGGAAAVGDQVGDAHEWQAVVVGEAAQVGVHAQAPAQPTPEQARQMQEAMARQMQMMSVMFDLRKSKLGFEETVNAIRAGAQKRGWKLGETQDMRPARRSRTDRKSVV